MKKLTYRKEGDYLIPNLAVKGTESITILDYMGV